ncbi:hypothetical protein OAT18_03680 [Tenacibaculum sp.]|nr:hypothetical protein [Tenacibaculum sp.]
MTNIYHILNETGVILVRSDEPLNQDLPEVVLKDLGSVNVFLRTMLHAISITLNPKTGKYFSIYDCHKIESLLVNSRQFFKYKEDKVNFKTDTFYHDFSSTLYYELFGVTLNDKETKVVSSILGALGKEAINITSKEKLDLYKAGYIMIIVDYIDGVSNVYLKLTYIDCMENEESIQHKPCHRKTKKITSWVIETASYLHISKYKKSFDINFFENK